jgi:hypothetical protein
VNKTIKILAFLFISLSASAQLTIDQARDSLQKYRLGSYSYHEQFIGHAGYGAPVILTADGGAVAFGGSEDEKGRCGILVKLDKTGKQQWKKRIALPKIADSEPETQSVVEDKKGNLYVFMIMYDPKGYRGGAERMVCYDKTGKLLWDKMLGKHTLMDNPNVSYIKLNADGKIYMRGHIVTEKPAEGKDPKYRYWEGWIDRTGILTQQSGDVIDWANKEWQTKFAPDK